MNRCGVQGDTGWGGSPLGSSDVRGRETETINSLNSEWSSWADTSVFVASLLKVTILREQQRQRGSLILNLLTKGGLGFHCTCQSLRSSSVYSCKQRLEETGAQRILAARGHRPHRRAGSARRSPASRDPTPHPRDDPSPSIG